MKKKFVHLASGIFFPAQITICVFIIDGNLFKYQQTILGSC